MSADTQPTRRPTHYRHVGRHTTDAFIEKLTFPNSFLLRLSVGRKNNVIVMYVISIFLRFNSFKKLGYLKDSNAAENSLDSDVYAVIQL